MKNFDFKIDKLLGGKDLFAESDYFIVTNIGVIYKEFLDKYGENNSEKKNIWKSSLLNIGNNKVTISKIPPGNNIKDYLKLVKFFNKKIILCGFCGSLIKDIKVGSLIDEIKFNKDENGIILKEVCGLIQEEDFYEDLLNSGFSILDMESHTLNKFGINNNIETESKLIVSDNVFIEPFYSIDMGDGRIHKGINNLINSF